MGLLEGHAQQGPRDKDIEVLFIPPVQAAAAMFCSVGGAAVISSCFGNLNSLHF